MKYFDAHLGLPSPDRKGLEALLRHVESEKEFVGGNLILNTQQEVAVVSRYREQLPSAINTIPYYTPMFDTPEEVSRSGWLKIHPRLHRFALEDIPHLLNALREAPSQPKEWSSVVSPGERI